MSLKRTIAALAVAACAYVGVASAQENATVTLRSGERLTAQLVDLNAGGFVLRVNGEERKVPTSDVAVIDFAGGNMTDADWARVTGGQHMVWLRSGETLTAELVDIGGTSPLRITVRADGGTRDLSSNEITRIVLARPSAAAAPATGTTGQLPSTTGSGLVVSARQQWTPTGITVRRGEVLTFNSTGQIQLSNDSNDIATVAGSKAGRYPAGNAPLPNVLAGGLIGRIGNGQPFAIGDQTSIPMPAAGVLFLGVNDDHLNDNVGEFRVEISRGGRRR
ncbi:MAG TPA: hypothetical protein VM364_08450 [Vicinamibacterales bacterium]|nr:hypothetical protein [Vicinamibacterales bacterium]